MAELIPRQAIAHAILVSVISAANAIDKAVKSMPAYKLPRIAFAARRRKAAAIASIYIAGFHAAARVMQVTAQPIPKYPEGCMLDMNTYL